MNPPEQSGKKPQAPISRNRIARAIFAAAESIGMSDRQLIEQLTDQIIERIERPQPLPGIRKVSFHFCFLLA